MTKTITRLAGAAAFALLSACGGAGVAGPEAGPLPDPMDDARGVPGFDTRHYPGDGVMEAWRQSSPYRWVGFYLPAPCYTGTTWQGKRSRLQAAGWGTAVVFVGEQDWPASQGPASAAVPADSALGEEAGPRCTRENLSLERGIEDGGAAAAAAAAEGFAPGTAIFLDVEPVEAVSERLAEYVRGWTRGLVEDGRYEPALYAHNRNADRLLEIMTDAWGAADRTPRLWVAKPGGFNLRRGPDESGFSQATVWQGLLDVTETWGGHELWIDANVATTQDPSG